MSADGRRGARSSSERTWRGCRVTSRSVGLPLLGISYLNVRHLLALLVVCRCLGSVQTILTWSPMTELTARALGTHDRNSGGRCWQNIDSKDLAYHRGDSQTPAPAQGRAPDPEPTPPLRVPQPMQTVLAGTPALKRHLFRHAMPQAGHQLMMKTMLPRAAGMTPAWTWPDQLWPRRLRPSWGCIAASYCAPIYLLTGSWEARSEACAAICPSSLARRVLEGEDLESWQTFEHRATHEYRPHRRDGAAAD